MNTRSKARRLWWALIHPIRNNRARRARARYWNYPPRPPYSGWREYWDGYGGECEAHVIGEAWELPPINSSGYQDTMLSFVEYQWAGRCRHVGPAGYMCTRDTFNGPHDLHTSIAPSGQCFDVWDCYGDEVFDETDTEAMHLAAGMCISHNEPLQGQAQYTCTLPDGHEGEHRSEGPEGEVFAEW